MDHRSWPYLMKLDELFMNSTVTGQFVHDGGNNDGESDPDDKNYENNDLLASADQALSTHDVFLASIITPFAAMSQLIPAAMSTPSFFTSLAGPAHLLLFSIS